MVTGAQKINSMEAASEHDIIAQVIMSLLLHTHHAAEHHKNDLKLNAVHTEHTETKQQSFSEG